MSHHRFAIVAIAVLATACSRAGSDDNAFRWTGQLPAGSILHIRDGVGSVTVKASAQPGQETVVTGSRSWHRSRPRDVKFVVDHASGRDYYVCAMWANSGRCGSSAYRGRSTNGFLTMFSLFHHGSDAIANITVQLPANVGIDARTTNGSVMVDGAGAGVVAKTSNGTVSASNVSGGPIVLSTINGNVRLSATELSATDSVHLNTTNGFIQAELPASLEGAFDLSTVNGRVHSDFPLASTSSHRMGGDLAGQIGTSTRPVRIRAINGGVSVNVRPASPGSR